MGKLSRTGAHRGNENPGESGNFSSDSGEMPAYSAPVMADEASTPGKPAGADKKLVAGLLGILLGGLGIHKFYLGYQKEGLIMLLVTLLTCGFGGIVMGPIGLIEGILYLVKSDEEFVDTYVTNKKPWF